MRKDTLIGVFDEVWAGSFLVRPGRTSYFVLFKLDATRMYKTEVTIDLQPRPFVMHHAVLPKVKEKDGPKNRESNLDNYYMNILEQWHLETP